MTARICELMAPYGLAIDYEADVLPLSQASEGGGVTERHILFALARKIMQAYGQGPAVVDFLEGQLGLPVSGKARSQLMDAACPIYAYVPVSYTHLDVYKRQGSFLSNTPTPWAYGIP